jgi:hypothetical protein
MKTRCKISILEKPGRHLWACCDVFVSVCVGIDGLRGNKQPLETAHDTFRQWPPRKLSFVRRICLPSGSNAATRRMTLKIAMRIHLIACKRRVLTSLNRRSSSRGPFLLFLEKVT